METRCCDAALPEWLANLRTADGLFAVDEEQRVIHWSESAERLLGYPADEALGSRCYELLGSVDLDGHPVCRDDCRVLTNARRGRVTGAYDIVARRGDGERVWLNSSTLIAPREGDWGPLLVHLVRERSHSTPARRTAGVPLAGRARRETRAEPLSRRELEVLSLVAAGHTTPEVAEQLAISRNTVRNHLTSATSKLGARNRTDAVLIASEQHLI